MILGVTGHRPPDLGGYSDKAFDFLVDLAKVKIAELEPDAVIQGMALGWDQACAVAAHALGIPYGCYIPFLDQPKSWPRASRHRWEAIRENAAVERVFGYKYTDGFLKQRNRAIVDDCDLLLANYNGYIYSGTAHAVDYAKSVGKPMMNVYRKDDYADED